jgi:Flagellar biosynthesis/type III secretory pathway lipoprotein
VRRRRAARPVGVDLIVGDEEAAASERELSAEERRRQELRDRVAALAREKPEEVAQLVKAWLMEE